MVDPRERGYDPDDFDQIQSESAEDDSDEAADSEAVAADESDGSEGESESEETSGSPDAEAGGESAADESPDSADAGNAESEPSDAADSREDTESESEDADDSEEDGEDTESESDSGASDDGDDEEGTVGDDTVLPTDIEPETGPRSKPTGSDAVGTGGDGTGGGGGGGFGGWAEGPAEDEEMPLSNHIEEMVRRLAIVAFVAAVVAVFVFPLGEEIINFLWYSILPGDSVTRPHLYSPLELVLTQIKVASLVGIILALPVMVYQSYVFMRPGLYPHERRYYLAAVPTSLVLAFVGVTFAFFVVLPLVFTYFLRYTEQVTRIAFALGQTFDLILILMGYLAIVFQIPLLVMLALMLNIVTRDWLVQRRLLFWGGFVGVAFLFAGVDPTGVSPIIIGVTMILLFEGTLFLARWTEGRGRSDGEPL